MILDENLFETTLGDTIADYDQEQALERVEDAIDNKRQIEKFKKYMLPETILKYLYDYKYTDIASVLGISEARVRDHVRKNMAELSMFLRYKTQPSPYLLKVAEQNKDVDLEKILSRGKPSETSLEESKKPEIKPEIKHTQDEIDYIKTATETAKSHLDTLKKNKDQYLPDPSDKRYDELLAKYEQLIKGFEETVEAGEKIINEIKRKSSIKEDYEKSDNYTVISQPDTNEEKFNNLEDALKYFEEEVKFLKNKGNLGEKKSVELINKRGKQVKYWEEDVKLEEDATTGADGTKPKDGTKYYIKVRTDDKGGMGASYVYGKIKEFPDGTKIGLHKTPFDELVATDIRTGMRIIGSHSPIWKGADRIEAKRKQSELFDQAHEILKSIDADYYKSIPNIENIFDSDEEVKSEEELYFGKDEIEESLQVRLNKSLKEDLSPEQEKEYGLTTMINSLIKDELEAIDGYNSAIVTLEAENKGEFTDVIRDIISEENKHIGQLQAILKELNPSTTANIDEGQQEGQEQIDQAVGVTEGDTEETTTTIDTEEGVIKTYKLDNVEKMGESLKEELMEYDPEEGWTEEDIKLHKSIDWKARNYEDYEVAEDSFKGKIHCYGANEDDEKEYTFHKFIRPNAIFAPYYKAIDFDNSSKGLLSPMYDGRKHNGYLVMDRYETQDVYDMLSEELSDKKLTKEEIKQLALDNFENGGDVVYSAWDDSDIEEFIQEDGTKKGLLDMFKKYHSIYLDGKAAAYDANHLKPSHPEDEEDDPDNYSNDFRPDDSYDKDYGPSNPWDAPGMRVSDFIKGVK